MQLTAIELRTTAEMISCSVFTLARHGIRIRRGIQAGAPRERGLINCGELRLDVLNQDL